jgi:hypothetical protein
MYALAAEFSPAKVPAGLIGVFRFADFEFWAMSAQSVHHGVVSGEGLRFSDERSFSRVESTPQCKHSLFI